MVPPLRQGDGRSMLRPYGLACTYPSQRVGQRMDTERSGWCAITGARDVPGRPSVASRSVRSQYGI